MIESDWCTETGDLIVKSLFEYDQRANMIDFTMFDSKNKLELKEIHKYNNKDLLVEVDDYSGNGKMDLEIFFTYKTFDQNGNWVKRLEIWKSKKDNTIRNATTIRKITYY